MNDQTEVVASTAPKPPVNYLGVNRRDRVQVFIDAANLMGMLRMSSLKLDYKLFMSFLKDQTRLVRASYYVLMREEMTPEAERVIDLIEYSGFDVIRKWGNEFQDSATGHFRYRGSVIGEMTVGMLEAADNGVDHLIMISGDNEMLAAVEATKQRNARVTIIGIADSVSNNLRRSCDSFVDLTSLKPAGIFFPG